MAPTAGGYARAVGTARRREALYTSNKTRSRRACALSISPGGYLEHKRGGGYKNIEQLSLKTPLHHKQEATNEYKVKSTKHNREWHGSQPASHELKEGLAHMLMIEWAKSTGYTTS
jgi:hypothetical protein